MHFAALLHLAFVNPQALGANTCNAKKTLVWWGCFRIFTSEVSEMEYGKKNRCGLSQSRLVTEPRAEHRRSHARNLGLGWTPPSSLSSEPLAEWPSPRGLSIGLWTEKPDPLWFWYSSFFQWHWTLSWSWPVLPPNHQLPFAYILRYGWERMVGRWVNLHLIHSTVTMLSRNHVYLPAVSSYPACWGWEIQPVDALPPLFHYRVHDNKVSGLNGTVFVP